MSEVDKAELIGGCYAMVLVVIAVVYCIYLYKKGKSGAPIFYHLTALMVSYWLLCITALMTVYCFKGNDMLMASLCAFLMAYTIVPPLFVLGAVIIFVVQRAQAKKP